MSTRNESTEPIRGDEAELPIWLPELMPGGHGSGFLEKTNRHSLMFLSRSAPVLLVTFDNLSNVRDHSPLRAPWAFKFARDVKASHLGILAHRPDWYRDEKLIARMQTLATDGFFEGYERVLFAGVSMGGYAALAFSTLAPSPHVLAFNPQSTLDTTLVPWETRFPRGRAQDWTLPYGDAADSVATAEKVHVLFDPFFELDRRHFERLVAPNVQGYKCWFSNHKSAVFLRKINALKPVMSEALFGDLTPELFYGLYRARRNLPWYAGTLAHYFAQKGRSEMEHRVKRAFRHNKATSSIAVAE